VTEERRHQPDRKVLNGERAGDQSLRKAVADRIAAAREARGLTIQQLADLAGMHYQTVREALYHQVDPKLSTLIALSAALDIPLTELVKPRAA